MLRAIIRTRAGVPIARATLLGVIALCTAPVPTHAQSRPSSGPAAPRGNAATATAPAPATPARSQPGSTDAAHPAPSPVRWPVAVPGLATRVADPGDERAWTIATRVDPRAVTVLAAAPGGALAVTARRARQGAGGSCAAQLVARLRVDSLESVRADAPEVFRGAAWSAEVARQDSATHDGEFGCLALGDQVWVFAAVAERRAGASLLDAGPMAQRLARALAAPTARRGFPLLLEASGLELDDPSDEATWLLTGRAIGFPVPSDALSSSAGESGGVTLTVARRPGSCAEAWAAFRAGSPDEGALVDRPGYVPAAFGARIRRIALGERLREVYCVATGRAATLVTAVFGATDADAMTRAAPMLRAIVTAAAREALGGTAGTGSGIGAGSVAPEDAPQGRGFRFGP